MIMTHNRRTSAYKVPYGAVPTGEKVTLRVRILPETKTVREVRLHYAYGLYSFYNTNLRMHAANPAEFDVVETAQASWYEQTVHMAGEANLFFYWFEVRTSDGRFWLIPDETSLEQEAKIVVQDPGIRRKDEPVANAFQITVYDRKFKVADWMKGGIMYQIFPDRFRRGKDYSDAKMMALTELHQERIWHQDWHEDVDIEGRTAEGYLALDFYGGSLPGITEKLDYLASLGVTILYLNPIFKARSNHRYDTGDYEQIDPMLGTEDDFIELCAEARARGMRVVLDGVFSHTGADSRYFNKFGRYPDVGAWQEVTENRDSPYSSWYRFEQRKDAVYYDSWWGFKDLPNVNEYDLGYREYITGREGVIARWLRLGASGWRLDVSDELPDAFIRAIRRAALREKSDAIILGEIWEDASAKFSYGQYRDFIFGSTHDSVMTYPIQKALLGFLGNSHDARTMLSQIETIREHYPIEVFYANMTMLDSHDTPRTITVLAGEPDPGNREAQGKLRLTAAQKKKGERLMAMGFLFLVGLPGTVSIFYGDEVGVEGYRDPYCRRTFPWEKVETGEPLWLLEMVREIGQLRHDYPVLATGYYRPLHAAGDHVVIERYLNEEGRDPFDNDVPGPRKVLVALNRAARSFTYKAEEAAFTVPANSGVVVIDGAIVLTI